MTKNELDIKIDPMNPKCPSCHTKMIFNTFQSGIGNGHNKLYLIPLICEHCKFELWIEALPCGCVIEKQFSEKIKLGDDIH